VLRGFGLLVFLVCLFGGPAIAETGQAVAVITDAHATFAGTTRVLRAGSDLAIGETVTTDANGQVQVLFSDNTELVIGPNSSLVLEDYLLRNDGSVGKLAVNALNGTFRFITGDSAKDRYAIKTPTGTIGVRGTAFDFFIFNGITYLIMYHGSTALCGVSGQCVEVSESCQIGTTDGASASVVGLSMNATDEERASLRAGFRYADNQSPLEESFRLAEVPACQLAGPGKLLPVSIAGVLATCSPVIAEQYQGTLSRWGECGAAVAGYVGSLDPNTPEGVEAIAELIVQLAELFKPGEECDERPTELPDAITFAGNTILDEVRRLASLGIAKTIEDCVITRTAVINPRIVSPS